jgi:NTE family protein
MTGANGSISRKPVNLALQGGGSHGAFTWGVLDKILEDGRLHFEAVSGTSAGAMNAVVMIDGWHRGGRDGARLALENFWRGVSQYSWVNPIQRGPLQRLFGIWNLDGNPASIWFDALTRIFSPYEFNPTNYNPLRDYLAKTVDFERVKSCDDIQLFISATNVHTGRVRVFDNFYNKDITFDSVMASACIPTLYQAVEIDGVPYWDGGYMGNPVLWPFFYSTRTNDLVIVEINPIERDFTPKTAFEIQDRLNEITFNASLQNELRAISFVSRLLQQGKLDPARYKDIRLHLIFDPAAMVELGASSKLNTEWDFLTHLRDSGRACAAGWLAAHFEAVGTRGTVDPRALTGAVPAAAPPGGRERRAGT